MQSELHVSPDAAPEILLRMRFAYVALAALSTYDYLTTLDEELALVTSSWRMVKFLYLVCRYLPFLYLCATLLRTQDHDPTLIMCQSYYSFNSYVGGLIVGAAEAIFCVRTYAIWNRSRRIFWTCIITAIVIVTPMIAILVEYNSSTVVTNFIALGVPGCSKIGESNVVFVVYVLLVVVETEILLLTLYRAVRKYEHRREGANVLKILLQHNIFYYACGLISSLVLIFAIVVFPASYSDLASSTQIIAHALLVTRMHRELWKSNEIPYPEHHSLTTFIAAAPCRSLDPACKIDENIFGSHHIQDGNVPAQIPV